MTAQIRVALLVAVAGLAGAVGGVVGVGMVHGAAGRMGNAGLPGPSGDTGLSGLPGTTGARGSYGPHMAMLLTDGQEAITYTSAVEANCAVEQSQSGCQSAVSGSETSLASMQNLLEADSTVGVPAGEHSRESVLATAIGSALSQLNRCGQLAVFALGGTSISSVINIQFYWSALTGCASPSAPFFAPQVTALQAWYRDAQTYAGP